MDTIKIDSRRELFVDDALIESMRDLRRVLNRPVPREIVLTCDAPWEGNNCAFATVFQDGDLYRMYYRGSELDWHGGKVSYPHGQVTCYAESDDGIHWRRPTLGIVDFEGTKQNNILLGVCKGSHNFTPFRDSNPACAPEAQYKAVGGLKSDGGLFAFQSPDGIAWSRVQKDPVLTEGAFDSQNIVFWDGSHGTYRAYYREFRDGRDIMTCTSDDFVHWSEPSWLEYIPERRTELYTNQILPYYRAPHILLGFPARYITGRAMLTDLNRQISEVSERFGTDYSDTGFMTSRDREHFSMWGEAFVRPGPIENGAWVYGDIYQNWGLVETASHMPGCPSELSVYLAEGNWRDGGVRLRRHTLRLDGFVSVLAGWDGGELVTKPLVFAGNQLTLNVATSAAGGLRVEIQNLDGSVVKGFALDDCREVFGDEIDVGVSWRDDPDLGALTGRAVRLRIALHDADLYAFRFSTQ